MGKQTAREGSFTQTETFTRGSGRMTKHMVKESTDIWMGPSTKEIGTKTSNMEKEKRHGQTNPSTTEISLMEQNMGLESSRGQTILVTLASLNITTSADKVNIDGAIKGATTAPGRTIRCMEEANSRGQMDAIILETTLKTKRKAKEYSHGQMVAAMMDHGRTASSMGEGSLQIEKEKSSLVNGSKASEYGGMMNMVTVSILKITHR